MFVNANRSNLTLYRRWQPYLLVFYIVDFDEQVTLNRLKENADGMQDGEL